MKAWKERLAALGHVLPPAPPPNGSYRPVVVWNGIAYVAGQVSRADDGVITGPVCDATDPFTLKRAAHTCVLRALAALDHDIGLDRVARILFLRGFVFAETGFKHHSQVLDPASDLLIRVLGPAGEHARSAIGVASLPAGGLLEVEIVAALMRGDDDTDSRT